MEQQTAVEWLEKLYKENILIPKSFEQAKHIESSQTDSEYKKGWEAAEKSLSKEIEKIHEYYRSHRSI